MFTIDDEAAFREAAARVISNAAGFELVGEAACGEDGLAALARLHPDLVLLDVRMPGMGGVATARRVRSAHPETVVILVSALTQDEVPDAEGCGAAAFVAKQRLTPRLLGELWALHG